MDSPGPESDRSHADTSLANGSGVNWGVRPRAVVGTSRRRKSGRDFGQEIEIDLLQGFGRTSAGMGAGIAQTYQTYRGGYTGPNPCFSNSSMKRLIPRFSSSPRW